MLTERREMKRFINTSALLSTFTQIKNFRRKCAFFLVDSSTVSSHLHPIYNSHQTGCKTFKHPREMWRVLTVYENIVNVISYVKL